MEAVTETPHRACTKCGANTPPGRRKRGLCRSCYNTAKCAGRLHDYPLAHAKPNPEAPPPPWSPAALDRATAGLLIGLAAGTADREQVLGLLKAVANTRKAA